jgi:hypothetical protein
VKNVLPKPDSKMTASINQVAEIIIAGGTPYIETSRAPIKYRFPRSTQLCSPLSSLVEELTPKLMKHAGLKYLVPRQNELRLILTNLILSAFAFEHLAISTRVVKGNYLHNMGLTRRGIESITALLKEENLCIETIGGYKHPKNPSKSRATQYFPTPKLIKIGVKFLYEPIGDFDDYSPYEYTSDNHWDVNEDKNISILRNYNQFMREHSWACKAPTVRKLGEEPFTNGRVYTPYQNIVNRRVKVRENTLLDGLPLVECDFTANHPFMLGYLSDHEIGSDFYLSISTAANVDRKMVKEVITKTIGANKKLSPQQLARNSKSNLNAEIVAHILNAIEAVHPWFKEFMFTNRGIYLQWLEGEIAMKMFEFGVAKGIPMINIHDAYAVSKSNQEITKEAMNKYRYEVLEEYKSRW